MTLAVLIQPVIDVAVVELRVAVSVSLVLLVVLALELVTWLSHVNRKRQL